MASAFYSSKTSALFILVTFSFLSISCSVTQDVLGRICFNTESEEYCEDLLNSDPRTVTAELPLLSLISIELAEERATENRQIFKKFQNNANTPSLRQQLEACVKMYDDILEKLKNAHALSEVKEYKNISRALGAVTELTYKCENGLPYMPPTSASSQYMILTSQSASAVNSYIIDGPPPPPR